MFCTNHRRQAGCFFSESLSAPADPSTMIRRTPASFIAATINDRCDDDLAFGVAEITENIVRGAFRWLARKDNADFMREHLRQKLGTNSKSKNTTRRKT